jgi:hypothetical protein
VPEFPFLTDLYSLMQDACDELNIAITNITKGNNNFVTYYLLTDTECAYIQFYYSNKGYLTTAMPKTFQGKKDTKLDSLINKLLTYDNS